MAGPECDVLVIGAGVVGLASAAALARAGRSVVVVERHDGFGRETTSRNSQVLHAGLYYPSGTWKARLCVAGSRALYARCQREGIPHRRIGKLVVATAPAEIATLERLRALGAGNGAPDLVLLDADAVRRMEPSVSAIAALHSPATGIIDAHALCLSFAAEAETHGAALALGREVVAIEAARLGFRVVAQNAKGERESLHAAAVVNAAGLASDRIAALAGIDVDARGLRQHPCKGDYFALAPGAPLHFERLVYPVPAGAAAEPSSSPAAEPSSSPGLGVHLTLDLGGRVRFGPDAEYVDRIDYAVDPGKVESLRARSAALSPHTARGMAHARSGGHSTQTRGARPGVPRLCHRRGVGERHARLREPRRHRVAGTHRVTRDRGTRRRVARRDLISARATRPRRRCCRRRRSCGARRALR